MRQVRRGGSPFPVRQGTTVSTVTVELHLRPGELVRVKPFEEILGTLNKNNRNRGLSFGPGMIEFCSGTFRVLKRVNRIVDEKTGRMLTMKYPCIVLQHVDRRADVSENRLFCPPRIHPYWLRCGSSL